MFQLDNASVKLVHLNIRTEKHGEDDALVLTGEFKKSRVEAVAGASAKHEFTLSTYPEDHDIAKLAAALGHEVELTLAPPAPRASNDTEGAEDLEAA